MIHTIPERQMKLGRPFLHMDTIGFGDNRPGMDDDDFVMDQINAEVLRNYSFDGSTQIAAVLITESFVSETSSLELILQKMRSVFGSVPSESIVVVGTKSNQAFSDKLRDKRKQVLVKIMKKHGIAEDRFVVFDTPCTLLDFEVSEETHMSQCR